MPSLVPNIDLDHLLALDSSGFLAFIKSLPEPEFVVLMTGWENSAEVLRRYTREITN